MIAKLAVSEQLFVSVTVTLKVPGPKPDWSLLLTLNPEPPSGELQE